MIFVISVSCILLWCSVQVLTALVFRSGLGGLWQLRHGHHRALWTLPGPRAWGSGLRLQAPQHGQGRAISWGDGPGVRVYVTCSSVDVFYQSECA